MYSAHDSLQWMEVDEDTRRGNVRALLCISRSSNSVRDERAVVVTPNLI